MWVKICGIRDPETALHAERAGADAIGVVLAPSPRQVAVEQARAITAAVGIGVYLLTVDGVPGEVVQLARSLGAIGVQPYGETAGNVAKEASAAGLAVLRPVSVGDSLPPVDGIPHDQLILLDTAVRGAHGGSGRSFDWRLTEGIRRPFVLAGGLTPATVGEAVTLAHPAGVDVSSGVESSPGIKDPALITEFIERAKA